MFNNKPNNIFGGGQQTQPQTNSIFGNNTGNVFSNANQNQTGLFPNKNNQPVGNQATNVFGQPNQSPGIFGGNNQNNSGPAMFNNPNQGNAFTQGANQNNNGIFAHNNQQQQGNMFNQPGNQGGIFNQGNQPANQGMFNQPAQPQAGNLFNQGNQQPGNLFNQNPQNKGFFNQTTQPQQNNFNQPLVGAGNNPQNPYFQTPMNYFNLLVFSPEQQQNIIKTFTNDQIRKFIDHCLKSLIDPKRLDNITLANDNQLRNQPINKVANAHNIKTQILQVKKELRDRIVNPINDLKSKDKALSTSSSDLANKVSQKLQKYKQRLIEAISEKKMLDDIKKQLDEIDNQIKDFLKPLFNSHQTRSSFSFIDPDQFCIRVSEQIFKNISYLDNKMDELLACEEVVPQQVVDTGDIIELLVQYYENVVISLREFTEKYHKQKKEVLAKRRIGNSDQALRKIIEKANVSVGKQLKAYELVKQIESILQKRSKRNTQMNIQ